MLPELGQLAIAFALLVAALLAVLPLVGAQRGDVRLMALARPAAHLQLLLVTLAFVILTVAFIENDFTVAYVANNSNSLLPLQYRISAVWGGHEGSLLLWVLVLAGWTSAVARFSRSLPLPVIARVLAVMGWISVGFLLFTLLTSSPFARLLPGAVEGRDLNPLLQDFGLIVHPPMLYMGYVGFAVAFAFAVAALLEGRMDAAWVRWSRPWTNAAWAFLTLGIALGSWWAYYELGWGGWWFWDPVENASFMPWLVGTALIHSQAVTEKRGLFRGWTLLLAIAAFSLSLLGTFLVRSGVLTSVHAFASSPERGVFILAFLGVVVGGSLLLYALRAPPPERDAGFAPLSRETFLLLNNLLLTTATAMVLLGTLYPLLADALDLGKISVGPPYFSLLFSLLMVPLVLALPFGPLSRWQREVPGRYRVLLGVGVAAALAGALALLGDGQALKRFGALAAGVWVLGGTAWVLVGLLQRGARVQPETAGMLIGHLGVAVFLFGVLMTEGSSIERDVAVRPGGTLELSGYTFRFDGVERVRGPNYTADFGHVTILRDDRELVRLNPEKRAYASGGQVMTEADIHASLGRDLYVALGEPLDDSGSWALRVYVKPWIRCIWLGALLMMVGGFVAAADVRLRRPVRAGREAAVDNTPRGAVATAGASA